MTPTPKVYDAIVSVIKALSTQGIGKDKKAQAGGSAYMFRGIDDVYNALAPLLAQSGLVILPRMMERTVTERSSAKGNAIFYVTVTAEFDFIASADGSKHTVTTYGEAMDYGDKATNKAMSTAYKYACFQVFCIPTEVNAFDSDADASQVVEVKPKTAERFAPWEEAIAAASTESEVKALREEGRKVAMSNSDGDLWALIDTLTRKRKASLPAEAV